MKKILISFMVIFIFTVTIASSLFLFKGKNEKIVAGLTDEELKEKIGQMILIGFRGSEVLKDSEIYKIIKDVKIGGVMLFDYDISLAKYNRNIINPSQTKKLIFDLQKYSFSPLFIAVDVEGGNVNRLKQSYGFFPIMSAEKMAEDKTQETSKNESEKIAKELKEAGFNMNLAPVVDLNINPKNPIIGALERSFSSDFMEVFNNAKVFIKMHTDNNIITVAKHFPGQGSGVVDSHLATTDITDTYKNEEIIPYEKLNNEGLLSAIMTAHIVNKKIDDKYPATLSKKFLQNILRNQIGFKGVIISDDIQMAAISDNYKMDEAIILAINAGVDIISASNNTNKYDKDLAYKISDIIFNAVKSNKIEEKRIIESFDRILNVKKQFKIIN